MIAPMATGRRWPVQRFQATLVSNPRNEIRLRLAAQSLAADNVHAACALCQLIFVTEPDHPRARALMDQVGTRIGAAALAHRPVETSLPRFLVIKSWGFGFWAEMCHVLGGVLLAEITGRAPVVHLGEVSRFGGSAAQDAFTHFFEPVSQWTLADIAKLDPAERFPAKQRGRDIWSETRSSGDAASGGPLLFLNAQERVAVIDDFIGIPTIASWIPPWHRMFGKSIEEVFRDLLVRYLRPNAEMKAVVERYAERHLPVAPFAAVHLRGHDKQGEVDIHGHLNELIMGLATEVPPDRKMLILTDNTRWLERFRAQFGDRVIVPEAARDDGSAELHFCLTGEGNPRLNGVEVLRDVLLATHAESFIGSGVSNVSAMVALLRRWPPGTCTLVSAPYIMQPMPYFYLDPQFHGDHARLNADEFVDLDAEF